MSEKRKPAAKRKGPVKPPRKATAIDKRELFVRHYMILKNITQAYLNAGYPKSASVHQAASNLFRSVYVQSRLSEERQKQLASLDVTVASVFQRYKAIAFADPAQITAYEVGACRYCNGINHAYQWRTEREYQAEVQAAIKESDKTGKHAVWPDSTGGYGYSTNLAPHPDCPECDGAGIPRLRFKDTRLMTDEERALFAGVEQTQSGMRYRFNDQADALKQLAEHLQFFKARDEANANAIGRLIADLHSRGEIGRMPMRPDAPAALDGGES